MGRLKKNYITNNKARGYSPVLAYTAQKENDFGFAHHPDVFQFFPKCFAFSGTYGRRSDYCSGITGAATCVVRLL